MPGCGGAGNVPPRRLSYRDAMRLMTDLEAAVARILPAAMVYPDAAPDALGHVLGLLARGQADPRTPSWSRCGRRSRSCRTGRLWPD